MLYFLIKWVHVMAAIAALGSNITFGFWMVRASREPSVLPFTLRTIKFIDDHANVPFFLEVTYNAAHWPFQVPDHPSVAAGHGRFVQPEENDTATRQDYIAILRPLIAAWEANVDAEAKATSSASTQ